MYYVRKVPATVVIPLVILFLYYYNAEGFWTRTRTFKEMAISLVTYNISENFLIDTPGCSIPNYMKYLHFNETKRSSDSCYKRVVFVEKSSDSEITFRIDDNKIKKHKEQNFACAYRFVVRSRERGKEDTEIKYMEYKPFNNGDTVELKEGIVQVTCNLTVDKPSKNHKISSYDDAYLILKKKPTDTFGSSLSDKYNVVNEKWNILIVGMDTMSRGRAYHSIPKTVKYLQENRWLDYRGYQKIASNTFPNVMAILSGVNSTSAYRDCNPGMDQCENIMIWNKFKEAGYMTAYGEDNLDLPDTFARSKGFTIQPTDHYTRPFFLLGEYQKGNILCMRSKPSAQHLLDYALQFSRTYKNETFFGHFWINSYSHNPKYLPSLFENDLISFFESLKNSSILNNTFVFFISDHGIRYGTTQRFPRESYYAERLPMLFMWVPYEFQETYPVEYDVLQLNQFRLITPYDLHATLFDIMTKTNNFIDPIPPVACPQCHSLTAEVSPERTCEDVGVDMRWCSCHGMTQTNQHDKAAKQSLELAVKKVQYYAKTTKTKKNFICKPLKLKKQLRNDWYKYGNKTYYIVAFQMLPGDVSFEATIEKNGGELIIIPPIDTITSYNVRGYCVVNKFDSPYCVCEKNKKRKVN